MPCALEEVGTPLPTNVISWRQPPLALAMAGNQFLCDAAHDTPQPPGWEESAVVVTFCPACEVPRMYLAGCS